MVVRTVQGYICTGTLIQHDLVVTAAHCAPSTGNATDIGIVYGAESIFDSQGYFVQAKEIALHPIDDIMVILLEDSIDVCAPILDPYFFDQKLNPGDIVTIAGYGKTYPGEPGGILMSAETPIDVRYANDSKIIVGGTNYPDICFGDSGGPIYVDVDGISYVTGVATSTNDVNTCNGSVFIMPSFYLEWIEETYKEMGKYFAVTSCADAPRIPKTETKNSGCSMVRSVPSSSGFILYFLIFISALIRKCQRKS